MAWQLPPDHADALEHPLRCFGDPELRRGQVLRDAAGRPQVCSGKLAEVYQVRSATGLQRWAVKCYREDLPGLALHYRALAEHVLPLDLRCLVPFQYLDRGLCVRGKWIPAVKMLWVDGVPLNVYVGQVADQPGTLQLLARLWLRLLADLSRAGIAHGALQQDHILVTPGAGAEPLALRLLDYDGAFVLARDGAPPCELGHPNYQHPQRLWQQIHDLDADRFAALVIYTALRAVAAHGPDLWRRHDGGDNFLFRERDYQEPATSAVFRALWHSHDADVRALAGRLLLAAQGDYRQVPSLKRLAAEADTALANSPDDQPHFRLTDEQIRKLASLLGGAAESETAKPVAVPAPARNTFGILIEDERPPTRLHAPARDEEDFGLVVEDHPEPPRPAPPPAPPPLPAAKPPPLPAPAPDPYQTLQIDDPYTATYYLEAWMPERVAVMKVQGFVDSAVGEVFLSAPGLLRVRLFDPYGEAAPPKPGLLAWLGFAEHPPRRRTLAVLEFHMQFKQTEFKQLLAITLHMHPGEGESPPSVGRWRAYCDKLYCDVRGFLMGTR
jgi:hypothetical protein